jgi:OmpA-OmpF porin, OOP family
MKRNIITRTFYFTAITVITFAGCKNEDKKVEPEIKDSSSVKTPEESKEPAPSDKAASFDINAIPVSTASLGAFPYIEAPENYAFNKPNSYRPGFQEKSYDKEYFYFNEAYLAKEGKTFKAVIRVAEKKEHEFSKLEIQKNFDEVLKSIGAVKLNNGQPIASAAKKKNKEEDPNAYTDGYLFSSNNWDNVHSYVLRKADSEVWFQLNLGSSTANLTVLETKPFVATMKLKEASAISQEIAEKGKAVLYINFDVNKATLKEDGHAAVAEIVKVLQADKSLKLSVDGYTDNTGNAADNKTLSVNRAKTVVEELVKAGIDAGRLKSNGFGAEKPIAANDTEDNKAKNRRVELVKL